MPTQPIVADRERYNKPFNVFDDRNTDPADPENLVFRDLNGSITLAATGAGNGFELDYPYSLIALIGHATENANVTIKTRQEIRRLLAADDTIAEITIPDARINLPAGQVVLIPLSNLFQLTDEDENEFEGKTVIESDQIIRIRVVGEQGFGDETIL